MLTCLSTKLSAFGFCDEDLLGSANTFFTRGEVNDCLGGEATELLEVNLLLSTAGFWNFIVKRKNICDFSSPCLITLDLNVYTST